MIQNTDVSQRAATHKTSRSLDIASVQASLDTLKGLSSPSQKRQDALVKLTKARDELRSYLRFMMFLLSPEKRSQLAAILKPEIDGEITISEQVELAEMEISRLEEDQLEMLVTSRDNLVNHRLLSPEILHELLALLRVR
ncbi:MAG: hypothetical protein EB006_12105, partial [Betaproteobacteria bacterium]|nr:hypothetical protein [Betaproteobacteria bacterium]